MRKLGLLGGMGPESTIPYYHDIVYGVHERAGRFPLLTIESVDVFHVLRLESEGRFDELADYLGAALKRLEAAGAQVAAMCANTPHIVFDRLQRASGIPLVSIVEACRNEACRRGFKNVGLLGTMPTMAHGFYAQAFAQAGIHVVVPAAKDQRFVADRISQELEFGVLNDATREGLAQVVERMRRQDGIDAVVLGCTELPLILNDDVVCVPCLDTMHLHIQALIDAVLDD